MRRAGVKASPPGDDTFGAGPSGLMPLTAPICPPANFITLNS